MTAQRVTGREAATVFDTDSGRLAIEFKDIGRQTTQLVHAYACAQLDVARRSECERWLGRSGRRGTGGGGIAGCGLVGAMVAATRE